MIRTLIALMLVLLTGVTTLSAQSACDQPTRLSVGQQARVIAGGLPNNLRAAPLIGATRIGQIPPAGVFDVLDGPQCASGYRWWQVDYQGTIGWTADGDTDSTWLEPLPELIEWDDTETLAACLEPPDDYTRVKVGNADFNARTLAMLDYAESLYHQLGGATVDFRLAITQGGYTGGHVEASFGTHDGGGAVDLSVRSRADFSVLVDDIPLMLRALRVAGFAAWLRDTNELYDGSPIHIHAIAIGDRELSQAARDQIDGPYGYLYGYNGLPQDDGVPRADTSGEMVICPWMIEQGFTDLR